MNCDLCEKKVDKRQVNSIENKYFICGNCYSVFGNIELVEWALIPRHPFIDKDRATK